MAFFTRFVPEGGDGECQVCNDVDKQRLVFYFSGLMFEEKERENRRV